MIKYEFKERCELTDGDRRAIYNYAMKCSDEIVRNAQREKEAPMPDDTRYKEAAEKLWSILDDIDTASDMIKPTSLEGYKAFYRYAMKQVGARSKILESRDGYTLVWPDCSDEAPLCPLGEVSREK